MTCGLKELSRGEQRVVPTFIEFISVFPQELGGQLALVRGALLDNGTYGGGYKGLGAYGSAYHITGRASTERGPARLGINLLRLTTTQDIEPQTWLDISFELRKGIRRVAGYHCQISQFKETTFVDDRLQPGLRIVRLGSTISPEPSGKRSVLSQEARKIPLEPVDAFKWLHERTVPAF